jgi:hypothetical protein
MQHTGITVAIQKHDFAGLPWLSGVAISVQLQVQHRCFDAHELVEKSHWLLSRDKSEIQVRGARNRGQKE